MTTGSISIEDPGSSGAAEAVPEQNVRISLIAAILAVTKEESRILTVKSAQNRKRLDSLPDGAFEPVIDRTLDRGLRRLVSGQSGQSLGYVEQLYTFGDRHREPLERENGPRVVAVAYLALVREGSLAGFAEASWRNCYRYFPWEDWRKGRPAVIDRAIVPALLEWAVSGKSEEIRSRRKERVEITFGLASVPWDGERVLERYELLYEGGLVSESTLDGPGPSGLKAGIPPRFGEPMALDHRRVLATALGRLRGKLKYRPVIFELLPPCFTLFQLQNIIEALAGIQLHKSNLRRLLESGGLVERTGRSVANRRGRPAELFKFRHEVLRERPAPGVRLPAARAEMEDGRPAK